MKLSTTAVVALAAKHSISNSEVERLAAKASNNLVFVHNLNYTSWWYDENNA